MNTFHWLSGGTIPPVVHTLAHTVCMYNAYAMHWESGVTAVTLARKRCVTADYHRYNIDGIMTVGGCGPGMRSAFSSHSTIEVWRQNCHTVPLPHRRCR